MRTFHSVPQMFAVACKASLRYALKVFSMCKMSYRPNQQQHVCRWLAEGRVLAIGQQEQGLFKFGSGVLRLCVSLWHFFFLRGKHDSVTTCHKTSLKEFSGDVNMTRNVAPQSCTIISSALRLPLPNM